MTSHSQIVQFNWECIGCLRSGGFSLVTSHWRCYLDFDVILCHRSLYVLQSRKKKIAFSNWYHFCFSRVAIQVTYTFVSICVHKTCRLVRTIFHSLCWMPCTCSSHEVYPPSLIMDSTVERTILLLQLYKTGSLTAFHFFKPGLYSYNIHLRLSSVLPSILWLLTDGKPQVLSRVVIASRHVLVSCDNSTILWLLHSFP